LKEQEVQLMNLTNPMFEPLLGSSVLKENSKLQHQSNRKPKTKGKLSLMEPIGKGNKKKLQ
jgi:hypothetical protein